MGLTYFKRFRMEIDLARARRPAEPLPTEYRLVPWSADLLEVHAEMKYLSFRWEIDSTVFPCFAERTSCLRLMEEISRKEGFLPEATWLLEYVPTSRRAGRSSGELDWSPDDDEAREFCGTVQGIRDASGYGAIQNLGIVRRHRDRGLGAILMEQALDGFRRAGLRRAYLEVTVQNEAAVRLYRRLGFRRVRTLYRAVDLAYS